MLEELIERVKTVMSGPLLSLDLIEVPFSMAGRNFVLIEPSEQTVAKYKDGISQGTITEFDGENKPTQVVRNPKVAGTNEQDSFLVSMCLWQEARPAENGSVGSPRIPVSLLTIRGWPRRVTSPLITACEMLGRLGDFAPK